MKNSKKLLITFIIVIIIISVSYAIYAISNNNNSNKNEQEKVLSEIKYLESKFVNILNTLNNIEYRNYKISTQKATNTDNSESSSQNNSSSNSSEGSETSSEEKSLTGKEETFNKYNLEAQGVLTKSENINWDYIKNDLELIYTSVPVVTLDLYKMNFNKDDILNFNNDLDSLTILVKNEDKMAVLAQVTKLYSYIPKFLNDIDLDEKDKIIIKTKYNIFEAYSILETEEWQIMTTKISDAINNYNSLITNSNINDQKQYNLNKCYIMLNELKNAINKKDKELFLIKYKNILEDFNNI